ncbi:hypothetical protein [Nocardioides ganghwensis]|uniref:Uncharacterized protein n=1 Tax=Nocardioides ganghwensis TaxID=252230 RepID=A0A4Q2S8T7_9ACTN|nr:hypothetical protein [Nocardioides ganghwensis]MBD3944252.1 hypothetical protein [Nocardioides ganghwensis]RYC00028.1 hypothetical protein EUA07_14650 [Nocardioides ganghwensis]
MSSRRSVRQVLVAVLLGVLVGGGLMAVTPAGAEVSSAVATNWKKIWKKNLKPLADKRYYTKKQSDAKYQPKGSYETAGSGYSKAETYSKTEVDSKLAPFVNSVAAHAGGDQALALSTTDTVVRSVSIMPPANGTVIVSSGGYIWATAASDVVARCSVTPGTVLDGDSYQYVNMPGAAIAQSEVIGASRGFAVTKGSLFTANLVCDVFAGSASASVSDSSLTAIFAPN